MKGAPKRYLRQKSGRIWYTYRAGSGVLIRKTEEGQSHLTNKKYLGAYISKVTPRMAGMTKEALLSKIRRRSLMGSVINSHLEESFWFFHNKPKLRRFKSSQNQITTNSNY